MTASPRPAATFPDRLLANRDYVRLFAAQLTSLLGSGVTSVALAVFAYDLVGSNATQVVGTALMLRILAYVLLSPIAGILADRIDRKTMMVTADVIRCALLALFPLVTAVGHIYALIFAINAVTAFFTPTYEASLPDVVGPALYPRALSASRVAVDIEGALGPLVAGALIATAGVRWTFWFDALTYVVSAALVVSARVPRPASSASPFPWGSFLPQVTFGTRILLREPALRRALVLHIAEATAGAVTIVTTVVYVRDVLQRGEGSFALLMGALGIGSSLAALWLARQAGRARGDGGTAGHLAYHRWAEKTLLAGGILSAVALLPGALVPGFGTMLMLWALIGAGGAMIAIPSVGLLSEHTRPDERGRAYAAHFALTHLFWLFTYPAAGYLARGLGTPVTFTLAGVACAVTAGFALTSRIRDSRARSSPSDT